MYIANDINHLIVLAKLFKVHELLPAGSLAISRMKTHMHGLTTKQQVAAYKQIVQLNIDDLDKFEKWRFGKSRHVTSGDLSTIYIALTQPQYTLLVSDEDIFLPEVCRSCNVAFKHWEQVIEELVDERMMEIYKYIKAS